MNEPMDDLERQLVDALQRKEPSAGFEQRVLTAASRNVANRNKLPTWFGMPRLRWAAALVMPLVLIVAVEIRREAAERAAGEAAKARLQLALKITGEKLRKIQDQVNAGQDQ
jgi:hypothetical protein